MATVEIQSMTKRYGKITAVDDMSLSLGDGEFFVVLGPSGAGKTTTLKSVAGLVDIDGGEVKIGGRTMTQLEPYHRNVGMAFESYALYPQKTVFENLASPLRSGRTGTYSGAGPEAAHRPGHHHARDQPAAQALPARAVQRAAPAGRARDGCWSARPTSTCSTSR